MVTKVTSELMFNMKTFCQKVAPEVTIGDGWWRQLL